MKNVLFKAGYPLGSKSENESNEDPEKESNDSADKDKNGEDERTRSLGPAKDSAEEKREAEEAKKEKEFKDLMGRFEMKKGKEEDDQAFIALQAGWESSIGEVTILGKITKDFGKLPHRSRVIREFLYYGLADRKELPRPYHQSLCSLDHSRLDIRSYIQ